MGSEDVVVRVSMLSGLEEAGLVLLLLLLLALVVILPHPEGTGLSVELVGVWIP